MSPELRNVDSMPVDPHWRWAEDPSLLALWETRKNDWIRALNSEGVDKTGSREEKKPTCSGTFWESSYFGVWVLKTKTFALYVLGNYLCCFSCYIKTSP